MVEPRKSMMDTEMTQRQIDMLPTKPDPNSQTVLTYPEDSEMPVVRDAGDVNFRCAGCKQILLAEVGREQYRHVIFKCPDCATYSRIPAKN